jgi:hypothetical protein
VPELRVRDERAVAAERAALNRFIELYLGREALTNGEASSARLMDGLQQ